jgi:hypothetical protein
VLPAAEWLGSTGVEILERAIGIEPTTFSLGSYAFLKRCMTLAAKPILTPLKCIKGL